MNKMIHTLALALCFSVVGISAHDTKDNCYLDELKILKKSPEHELVFNEDADPGLVNIQKSLEICKDLSFLGRLARFMFMLLDPVIVTATTMPKLHAYVDDLCKKAGIATPTIFITSDKHGFFNAAASKLFTSTGGIIIGQKMIYETSQAELEAIVAHEIGHIKYNHVNKSLALPFASWFGAVILTNCAVEGYRQITDTNAMPYTENQLLLKAWVPLIAIWAGPSLIVNKRFEKQADQFAFENGKAQGFADMFQYLIDREAKYDKDFDTVYANLQNAQSKIAYSDYLSLMFFYYLTKGGHLFNKFYRYVYTHTPLGAHPSHEARIQAAQEYLAQQSDWEASQN